LTNAHADGNILLGRAMAEAGIKKAIEEPKDSQSHVVGYSQILEEHDVPRLQRATRTKLLEKLEEKSLNEGHGPNGAIAHISVSPLTGTDVPILGNVLREIGDVHTLNLVLHSPGGDGTAVEKFVSLCRTQCQRLRVIIPNEAKSAATMIALGADEIVMGPCSELGPIDAQVPVVSNGISRYVSAQSFIDARDNLLKQHADAVAKGENVQAILQMLASLDIPFIEECKRMMDFGRDVVRKLLSEHMFKRASDKNKKINKIVDTLSSVTRFKIHGRLIDGSTARRELGLKVKLLGRNDVLWQRVWEYYTRAEIALAGLQGSKMFETRHETLIGKSGS
jgi:hypothetical protein